MGEVILHGLLSCFFLVSAVICAIRDDFNDISIVALAIFSALTVVYATICVLEIKQRLSKWGKR